MSTLPEKKVRYLNGMLTIMVLESNFLIMDNKSLYPIRYVSQRTGLTPHVIGAWEKRYQAVVPHRSSKNRRLYCEDDDQRLQLLKKITNTGQSI